MLFQLHNGGLYSPHTSLHWKQRTHTYMICCHIAHNNEIFIILTRGFSKEQHVFPEDDMRYAIEICRSNFDVILTVHRR